MFSWITGTAGRSWIKTSWSMNFLDQIKKFDPFFLIFWSWINFFFRFYDPDQKKKVNFWSGSKIFPWFYDPDQKKIHAFLIRIKSFFIILWSGSKIFQGFFDPDQKIFHDFWSRIKKISWIFWSGSKNFSWFFDPDQKKFIEILIRIKKNSLNFWSGSKNLDAIFDPDHDFFMIQINKNLIFFWNTDFIGWFWWHPRVVNLMDLSYFRHNRPNEWGRGLSPVVSPWSFPENINVCSPENRGYGIFFSEKQKMLITP